MKLREGKTKSKEMKQKLYFGQKKNKGKRKNKTLTHEALNFSLQHPGTLGIKDDIPDGDSVTLTNMEGVQEMSQCLDPYVPVVFWSVVTLGLEYSLSLGV